MVAAEKRVCEWDADPNPLFNFWTIGNVSEVVPGVVRPFTATFYRPMDHLSTKAMSEWVDVQDLVPSFPPPTGNFISVYAGRFALNLAWANAIIATWQVGGASGLMDQYITSTDGADITAKALDDKERAQRIWLRVRRIWGQLPRLVELDRAKVEALLAEVRARDLSTMSDKQLWRLALRLRQAQIMPFMRHLGVSGAAGDHTDRLNKFLTAVADTLPEPWGGNPALAILLTSALRDVESTRPSKGMWELAKSVSKRKRLAAELHALAAHAIADRLATAKSADWKAFKQEFAEFIARYGYRGQREADLSAADWSEDQTFALSAVKAYLDAPESRNPYTLEEQSAQQREAIEAQIGPAIPRALRREYRELLTGAQKFTRMRETTKAIWVRSVRALRPPVLELGRRFATRGLLDDRDDIFWLTEAEVAGIVGGGKERLQNTVARRKAEAARLEETELPEVFTAPITPTPKAAPEDTGAVLTGMPVSFGVATGKARVILSAEAAEEAELEPGEVLVAPYTDAPWTPLFVPAVAVVVETGGILSHAATVAREFGIPAVVAVKGATRLIKTGQTVTVDGLSGTVTVET